MKSNEIRRVFKDFFISKGHTSIASSNLVPNNDQTLLFTNAGMVQFKDLFLGMESKEFTKATTSQKCLRAGGKHNDLDNVGYTSRHHTFFEMLGNFSFGDYFKQDAIKYAWEFLTIILKIPQEKLWVSVYSDDLESYKIWINDIGFDKDRISIISSSDNFWSMGDVGPCGPCTEIFYDHGDHILGGPPGSTDEDGDRYVEIWNIVFMQYNRKIDGKLEDLPNPSVDTGMGLERIAAILQGVSSNYDIDIFQYLIKKIASLLAINDYDSPSLRVIADHIRSCSFLIAEGVSPSNEGRGYVLRRIIRRAIRHGYKLTGIKENFFYLIVPFIVEIMGDEYPELKNKKETISHILKKEEIQFSKTLDIGMRLFEQSLIDLVGKEFSGKIAFKLYDTYGFPLDLTQDLSRERGLVVNIDEFNLCMDEQRRRAKSSATFKVNQSDMIQSDIKSEFVGYSSSQCDSTILALFDTDGTSVEHLNKNEQGILILNKSPYYAEAGGQVGDSGYIESFGSKFFVTDTQKVKEAILHYGYVESGNFSLSDEVTTLINLDKRNHIRHNHSATHLLHASLRKIIGDSVQQKGSHVDQNRLRFDFSCERALTDSEIKLVEETVNTQIRNNLKIETVIATPEQAKALGALALFGEKYGDLVRVLRMGDFSIELCGGTHSEFTGEIGYFKIISESGIASGVRRIEAITGAKAESFLNKNEELLKEVMSILKTNDKVLLAKLTKLVNSYKVQEKELIDLKLKLSRALISEKSDIDIKEIGGVLVYANILKDANMSILRESIDKLKAKYDNIIVLLAADINGRVQIATGVSKKISEKYKANELVNFVAKQVGGKGGGRPDMAQAGGNDSSKLKLAVDSTYDWVKQK